MANIQKIGGYSEVKNKVDAWPRENTLRYIHRELKIGMLWETCTQCENVLLWLVY